MYEPGLVIIDYVSVLKSFEDSNDFNNQDKHGKAFLRIIALSLFPLHKNRFFYSIMNYLWLYFGSVTRLICRLLQLASPSTSRSEREEDGDESSLGNCRN